MSGNTSRRYPPELKERVVWMLAEVRGEHESDWAAIGQVSQLLGIGSAETVRKWVRQAEVDAGARPGTTSEESAEVKRLRRENAELKRANAILKAASAFFAAELDRARSVIVAFICDHQGRRSDGCLRWGVESICRVLSEHGIPIAPSTYYEHLTKTPTTREQRDEQLGVEVARVHAANFGVYGARKVWLQLNREHIPVARCTVERLMKTLGLQGAVCGTVKRTTVPDPAAERARDLVRRGFAPLAPDRLWVADLTYVSTWAGWVYVAFVVDAYARRILGWRTATTLTTSVVLDALEQAIWTRGRAGADLRLVVAHSDRGSQYTAIRYAERLADCEDCGVAAVAV